MKAVAGLTEQGYVEQPQYLLKIPPALQDVGVLLAPLSVVEKGVMEATRRSRS
jgi:glucose 1-dehydrogenase